MTLSSKTSHPFFHTSRVAVEAASMSFSLEGMGKSADSNE